MKKYLITGGCGFIGSHLAHYLIQNNHQVRILDDLSKGTLKAAPQAAEILVGNLNNKKNLIKALQGIDGCFHLAAKVSIEDSIKSWSKAHTVNTLGTIHLLETLRDLNLLVPIVYASSAAVYGNSSNLPLKEESLVTPTTPYGADKLASEHHAGIAWHLHRIPTTVLRFFNVYGSLQDKVSVISLFAKKILQKRPITIYGDGSQQRDFIHVDDIARVLYKAMETQAGVGQTINVCTGKGTTINTLVDTFSDLMKIPVKKTYKEARKGDLLISMGDTTSLKNVFKIEADISLEKGIEKYLKLLNYKGTPNLQ